MSFLDDNNHKYHVPFLRDELLKIINDDPFISRFYKKLGNELTSAININRAMAEPEGVHADEVEFLFYWIQLDGGIESEWVQNEKNQWEDDHGDIYQGSISLKMDGCGQLAALGLYLTDVEYSSDLGPLSFEMLGYNSYGFKRSEIDSHRAECLLLAYKSLTYAQRLRIGIVLSEQEVARSKAFDFSKIGTQGAKKRHEPMAKLREWTISEYLSGSWKSANSAAFEMQHMVIAHGRTINAVLSLANAQRTIYQWILSYNKEINGS